MRRCCRGWQRWGGWRLVTLRLGEDRRLGGGRLQLLTLRHELQRRWVCWRRVVRG